MKGKEKAVIKFFQEAFCIDGKAKVVSISGIDKFKIKAIVEMNDSKRGRFFIGLLEEI